MTITAGMVKDLREKTGVGMMECKKALQENSGDLDKAIVWLRERGMSRAAKKEGRTAAEGLVEVLVSADKKAGVLVELNCETDFASRNEDFRKLAHDVAKIAHSDKISNADELLQAKIDGVSVKDHLMGLIAKIGENMQLRRVKVLTVKDGIVAGYSHMGGKIGTLVAIEGAEGADELAKDIAMHIAAASPKYLVESEVDVAELDLEKEIARKRLLEEGKPADLIDKILVGQMKKFYKEVCLTDQAFIKDPNISVAKHVDAIKKGAKISAFARFQLGEGIEKKKENFAEEVAAQLNK